MHARDAAQAKVAAIGSVNPRAGGLVNRTIQTAKKTIARALQWFVRDQIAFNRETISAIEAIIEALNDHNRALVSLAAHANEQIADIRELKDMRSHWPEWRADFRTRKVAANEIQLFCAAVADQQGAFQHRTSSLDGVQLSRTREGAARRLPRRARPREHRYSNAALG